MENDGLNIKTYISWIIAKCNTHSYERKKENTSNIIFTDLMVSGLRAFCYNFVCYISSSASGKTSKDLNTV